MNPRNPLWYTLRTAACTTARVEPGSLRIRTHGPVGREEVVEKNSWRNIRRSETSKSLCASSTYILMDEPHVRRLLARRHTSKPHSKPALISVHQASASQFIRISSSVVIRCNPFMNRLDLNY